MSDSQSETKNLSGAMALHPLREISFVALQVVAIALPVAGIVWCIQRLDGSIVRVNIWTLAMVSAIAVFITSGWGFLIRQRNWSRPLHDLLSAIENARHSKELIEELSQIGGGIQPLTDVIRELLHAESSQKANLIELNQEMRDRLASKTDALERKIGSLRHQAMRDALTGLFNRRSLELELPRLVLDYRSNGNDACLLMMDLDNFKALNDTLGHAAGDQLLKEIGQIIRSTIREQDLAFRCGGDEFVVLLLSGATGGTREIAQRLESLVEVLSRPLHLPLPPRLSVGACCLSDLEEPTAQAWLEVADKRLYDIKASRKNRRLRAVAP